MTCWISGEDPILHHGLRRLVDDVVENRGRGLARERPHAREKLVEDAAGGEDVGPAVELLAPDLLR
jgi:hypothetical protein